jgi:hypothetical protein
MLEWRYTPLNLDVVTREGEYPREGIHRVHWTGGQVGPKTNLDKKERIKFP